MTYTILNEQTGRSFETISMFEVGFQTVWRSVMYFFQPGTHVTITDLHGHLETFVR